MTNKDCFMYTTLGRSCGVDENVCNMDCPFRKTEEEQREIEKDIVRHLVATKSTVTYKSRITKEVLYQPMPFMFGGL